MKSIQCLIQLELNGLSVDTIKTNSLITMIQEQMTIIEKQGFELAGRKFQFSSSKDVARVRNTIRKCLIIYTSNL